MIAKPAALLLALSPIVGLGVPALGQAPSAPPAATEPPAPADEITLVLEGRSRPLIRLAFPAVEGIGGLGALATAGRTFEETLRADLAFSRYFEIRGPEALSGLPLTGERSADFALYRSLGNEFLLATETRGETDRLVVEARLYGLPGGESVVAKRYRGDRDSARRIAHTLADEIIRSLTGRSSVALSMIAFTSDRSGHKEIYLMDYDGANVRRLTGHKSTSMSSAWRPDGSGLAYVSFWSGRPSIYFAQLPSGAKSELVTEGNFNISPTFSPDGQRLAFTRALEGNSEIFVADRGGANARRLTFLGAIDTNAAWSPKGNLIAFTSSRTGNPNIFVMDPDGTGVRRVSSDGDYNDGASFSPDGNLVAYASRRGGIFQIAVTDVVTGETRLLTSGPGSKEEPSFSPDGRHIVFSGNLEGGKHIYAIDLDGQNLRRLTTEGRNEGPAWSPAGASGSAGS
jgi:TolB protein